MTIWLVSDTHFCHENLIKYVPTRQHFVSVEEMNETIISEWNQSVSPTDEVIHLGDFILGSDLEKASEIINRLNFKRLTLIVGNHDTNNKIENVYAKNEKIFVVPMIQDEEFILTHYPVHPNLLEEHSLRSNGINERFNIHGHIHNGKINDKRYLNLNWDALEQGKHFVRLNDAKEFLREHEEIKNKYDETV